MNFWQKLKKKKGDEPILCLAPMADVTDRAFRRVIAKYGKPDVMWTEFVSAEGLFKGGYDALVTDLSFDKKERPVVAQFFTSKPEMMERAAALAVKLGFDGIDINMGCPDKSVEKQGAGAALMKDPKLAQEIILAAKKGTKGEIPVSVKTRIGWNKNELETWLPAILETEPDAITIHARTRKNLSLVPANWDYIKRAVEIRDRAAGNNSLRPQDAPHISLCEHLQPLIIGNGDVKSVEEAKEKARESGCDGVMIGRGIFGNPWLFSGKIPTEREKLKALSEHVKLFHKLVESRPPKGQGKSFAVMKKHFKAYVNDWRGAKELRARLMEAADAKEACGIISGFLESN